MCRLWLVWWNENVYRIMERLSTYWFLPTFKQVCRFLEKLLRRWVIPAKTKRCRNVFQGNRKWMIDEFIYMKMSILEEMLSLSLNMFGVNCGFSLSTVQKHFIATLCSAFIAPIWQENVYLVYEITYLVSSGQLPQWINYLCKEFL